MMRKLFDDLNVITKESKITVFLPLQSTNIENRVQIPPILYSPQPIRLNMFFVLATIGHIISLFAVDSKSFSFYSFIVLAGVKLLKGYYFH